MALCTDQRSTNQTLESMKWYFGKKECRKITMSETDSDFGDYFELNTIDFDYTEKKYVIFLDDSVASAPSVNSDQTLISVAVTSGDTSNDKATAMAVELAAITVRTEVIAGDIEIQNAFVGPITIEDVSNATNLTFVAQTTGFGGYIGQTGESELTTTVDLVQLMDDAQGTVIQDEIITGYGAEITIPVKEMTTKRWQDLIGSVSGNNVTIDGKEITGWGTEKLYKSMFLYAGRLVGHPVRLDDNEIDEDITMLNTAPKMNKINFSGQTIQEAEFLFTSYKDANADKKINLVARGDHSKF
tara:strand:- start:13575 stop:14474 length:900 start_codon:yes stop_codon:yes gene_type:complete